MIERVIAGEKHEELIQRLRTEWLGIVPAQVPPEAKFVEMNAEAQAIRAQGRWVSGPADVLTILRRHRDELSHSRLLGWLLMPTGRHGLGDRFLRTFLDEVFPGEGIGDGIEGVTIQLEVVASGHRGATAEMLESRADLVIRGDGLVVVVENKVDAGEQPGQCERLYWSWAEESADVRWVFLTTRGTQPQTVFSDEAKRAFRTASYVQVQRALVSALSSMSPTPINTGRASALQYLATLTDQFKT